jgi:hypothetical protein
MRNRSIPFMIILATLTCFALSPCMQGVLPPPPGGYPNFTTAAGDHALQALTLGVGNTAIGTFSLFSVSTGNFNTAVGAGSLDLNVGDSNTATGAAALLFNTTGTENTAVGTAALEFNNSGNVNSAFGALALISNTGSNNTAIGDRAMLNNVSGGSNTAVGQAVMLNNHTGNANIAIGVQALGNNDSGNGNIVLGNVAGSGITTANNVICIGLGGANVDNRTYIANINTTTVSGGGTDTVTVDLSTGLLGHLSSSRRYKEEIQPMNNSSETLYRLKPVTYRFKKEIDTSQSLDYGLVAEDVAAVDPSLAIRDGKGQIEAVRYTAINAMLLNEFLKEHKKVEDLEGTVASLVTTVKEQAAQIQKVSAQVEVNNAGPKTVLNNP